MKRLFSVILYCLIVIGLTACSKDSSNAKQSTTPVSSQTSVSKLDIGENTDLSKYVFVGDSRFVGIQNSLKGFIDQDVEIVAKIGEGLKWFKTIAPDLYKMKGKTIIFNFGVNDLYNADKYIEFYNGMPEDFKKDNTLVFMSVNPVDEAKEAEHGFKVKNTDIEKFNDKMNNGLDKQYFHIVDTNTYLQRNGFVTTDGLHYFNNVNRQIFEYTVKCCEKGEFISR